MSIGMALAGLAALGAAVKAKPYVIRGGKKYWKLPWWDCQQVANKKWAPKVNGILLKHGILQEMRKKNPDWDKMRAAWAAMPAADKRRHDSGMEQWGRAIQRCIDAS